MLFSITSCTTTEINYTESISETSVEAILIQKADILNDRYPERIDLIGKSTSIFTIIVSKDIPANISKMLQDITIEKIQETRFYDVVLSGDTLKAKLEQNNNLNQLKDVYLDSLGIVSVSDKDISNPLGTFLEVDSFLVLQLDQWPCLNCADQRGIGLKLRLVDTKSGLVIWTGIMEANELEPEASNNLEKLTTELVSELVNQFYNYFKKKWHRKRYDNLAELSRQVKPDLK